MMVRVHSESELKRKRKKEAPTHKEIRRTWWRLARKSNADLLLIFPMRHTDFFDFKNEILETESRDRINISPLCLCDQRTQIQSEILYANI